MPIFFAAQCNSLLKFREFMPHLRNLLTTLLCIPSLILEELTKKLSVGRVINAVTLTVPKGSRLGETDDWECQKKPRALDSI